MDSDSPPDVGGALFEPQAAPRQCFVTTKPDRRGDYTATRERVAPAHTVARMSLAATQAIAAQSRDRTNTGNIEPEPGQLLARSTAASKLQVPDNRARMEALELLAQSTALFENLKGTLTSAQSSGDAAAAALSDEGTGSREVSLTAPPVIATNSSASSTDSPSGGNRGSLGSSSSAAIDRARSGNAENLTKLRMQLDEALALQMMLQRELEGERAHRLAAEAKMEAMRVAWETAQAAGTVSTPPPSILPPSDSSSGLGEESSGSRSVELELEKMHLDAQKSIGQPKTPGQFVQSAVAGALAGTASNAVKLLNNIIPRSPGGHATAEGAASPNKAAPWAVGDPSQWSQSSGGPYGGGDED